MLQELNSFIDWAEMAKSGSPKIYSGELAAAGWDLLLRDAPGLSCSSKCKELF